MSDLVFNPEYRFSHAVAISSRIERVNYIHVLWYTIQGCLYYVTFLPQNMNISSHCTDKQNALRRECTFNIEIVLEIGVTGVNIYLKITVLTLLGVLARQAHSVRPWRMVIDFTNESEGHAFEPNQRHIIFFFAIQCAYNNRDLNSLNSTVG